MAKRVKDRKPGRPTREKASASALIGVDLAAVDPLAVLRSVAADTSAPAAARVSAARALLRLDPQSLVPTAPATSTETDPVARRALRILNGGKK